MLHNKITDDKSPAEGKIPLRIGTEVLYFPTCLIQGFTEMDQKMHQTLNSRNHGCSGYGIIIIFFLKAKNNKIWDVSRGFNTQYVEFLGKTSLDLDIESCGSKPLDFVGSCELF